MVQFKIYSTATCAFCHALKDFLDKKGIKYEEARVDQDASAANEMIALSGQMGVPFTVVTYDNGEREGVLGFNRPRFEQILNANK